MTIGVIRPSRSSAAWRWVCANTLAAGSTTNYVGAYVAVANSATITVTTANAHGTVSLNGNNLGTYNGVTPISAIVPRVANRVKGRVNEALRTIEVHSIEEIQ